MRGVLTTLVLIFSQAASPAAQPAAQHPPTIRVESERVLVDVFVFDSQGAFVSDLQAADFEVVEAGKVRPVTNLLLIDRPALAAADPATTSPLQAQHATHQFVVVLDRVSTDALEYRRAVESLRAWVRELPRRAQLALFVYDGRLRLVQGFTGRIPDLLRALNEAERALPVRPLPQPAEVQEEIASLFSERLALGFQITDTTALADLVGDAMTDAVRTGNRYLAMVEDEMAGFFRAMERLVESLGHLPGSKNVLLFTRGYALRQGEDLRDLLRDNIQGRVGGLPATTERNLLLQASQISVVDVHARAGDLVGACNARQVRLYTLDPSGLTALLPGGGVSEKSSFYQMLNLPDRRLARNSRSLSEPIDSLVMLSKQTNGLAFYHRNELLEPLQAILEHNSKFYLLGYEPAADRKDGKFYPVKVRLRRAGKFRVLAERGYLYRQEEGRGRLDYALAFPGLFRQIPFEARTASFRQAGSEVTSLSLEIPGSEMPLARWQDGYRASLAVSGVVLDPQGKAVEQFSLPFEVFLDEQQYRDFRERSFIVYHELRLPPGRYELRALIGESASDQLGAALTEFEVPSRDGSLSLSGLVLSQDIRSSSPDRKGPMFVGAHRVVPEGDSRVRPADPVYVYFQIYNLAGGESGPSGRVHLRLQDREGKVRYSRSLPVSRFNLPGAVAVSHELPLELLHLSAGDYSVEVEVEDEISGQRAEARIALRPEDR